MSAARTTDREEIVAAFRRVRAATERLAAPLSPEDQALQSMPACSPTKWHRAHTSWFFETFVLAPRGIARYRAEWAPLFNSYYVAAGPRGARPKRGMLSRPSTDEVAEYRRAIDERVTRLILEDTPDAELAAVAEIVTLGLHHEEQHQELLLTDILHALHENPLAPAYRAAPENDGARTAAAAMSPLTFCRFDGGVREMGIDAKDTRERFYFDNEEPRHKVYIAPFELGSRLVTVGEWKAFADARGYETPEFWLSEGFDWIVAEGIRAPLYARYDKDALVAFGLNGMRELHDDEPISHISYYEADAIARFLGARLPTEAEWECAAATTHSDPNAGNFVNGGALRPLPARRTEGSDGAPLAQLFGDAWEWTSSAYAAYPGFEPRRGALGEYNGKFMVNQFVLRGGSCLTPRGHVRPTYRNFWHPDTRFQMTGLRLARTVKS